MSYLTLGLGLTRLFPNTGGGSYKNLLLYTQEFDAGAWAKNGIGVTADAIADPPPGATTADVLTGSLANSTIGQTVNIVRTGVKYSFSIYLKAPSALNVNIDLIQVGGNTSTQVASLTTSWQRFSLSPTVNGGITQLTAQLSGIGVGAVVHAYGAQLERRYQATTYSRRGAS